MPIYSAFGCRSTTRRRGSFFYEEISSSSSTAPGTAPPSDGNRNGFQKQTLRALLASILNRNLNNPLETVAIMGKFKSLQANVCWFGANDAVWCV